MTANTTPNVPVLPGSASQADQAVYTALKLSIYYRLLKEREDGVRHPTDGQGRLESPAFFQGLTARRVRRIIDETDADASETFTELYRATPQLFYQRLLSLNHGLVLEATAQTFRRNKVFAWREALYERNLCTIAGIVHHIGRRFHLGADMIRLYEAFGDRPFARDDFVGLFRDRLSAVLRRHGSQTGRTRRVTHGSDFGRFMAGRLDRLRKAGLVAAVEGTDGAKYRLTDAGFEVGLYLDLFLHNIWFNGGVPYCRHCQQKRASAGRVKDPNSD